MSNILQALSSKFGGIGVEDGTEEDANVKSYGHNGDEFYVLFNLNGFLGAHRSGAHRAIIAFQTPSSLKVTFTDQNNTERLDAMSINLNLLSSISILSKYHSTADARKQCKNSINSTKLIGYAARTSEIVLSFSTNITVTSNVLWIWAPSLEQRNFLIQDIDNMYTNLKRKPPNVEQVKMKDIVQRHKFITSINSPRTPQERKKIEKCDNRRTISCKICHEKVAINKLKEHTCVAKDFIRCSHAKELPAPDKYQNYVFQQRTMSHGVISEARPKCELDWALIRSTKVPGPGYYGDINPFGTDIPGNGKINDAKPKDYLEQAIFNNKHAPGPGKYPMKQFGRGIKGGKLSTAMPKTDVEWKMYFASQTPAPHDYNIPYNLGKNFQGGKFSLDKRPSPLKNKNIANEPGPSDYQNSHSLSYNNKNSNKGAIISTANPPSSVDLLVRRSRRIPAPHDYYNKNQDFGQNIEGGKISKAKVPSEIAKQIRLASEIPGVGEYDVRKYENTSTKTLDFGKTEDRWPDKNRFHHYQPNPGPGEYISNASSMGYQVESQYNTAPSSMLLRKHEIIDSRSKYNTGPGKYEYVDSFGTQVTSGKKTNPIVAFGKGEGHQHRSPPIDTE
eukprot:g5665.t1